MQTLRLPNLFSTGHNLARKSSGANPGNLYGAAGH